MKNMDELTALTAIGSVDGRYRKTTLPLAKIFSEDGLIAHRVLVEVAYLKALSANDDIPLRAFTEEEIAFLDSLLMTDSTFASETIKQIETKGYLDLKATNHDVQSVVEYLKIALAGTSLKDCIGWVHIGLTSEDVNNLAYSLMIQKGTEIVFTRLGDVQLALHPLREEHSHTPMLSETHGQPATPTTFGKEIAVFVDRLARCLKGLLESVTLTGKLNGATGTWADHHVAFPHIDWPAFSRRLIEDELDEPSASIPLEAIMCTTQIEPHDSWAALFDALKRMSNILIDLSQDMWAYISKEWVVLRAVDGEIGSSAMPHKVNPINFENAEGRFQLAIGLFETLSRKLQVSRRQRDLSDSTVEREIGTAFAHMLIGLDSLAKGLSKITPDKKRMLKDLRKHPEVISASYQIILRREGKSEAYNTLKEVTRGKKVTLKLLREFIKGLKLQPELEKELLRIKPENYLGLAPEIAMFKIT